MITDNVKSKAKIFLTRYTIDQMRELLKETKERELALHVALDMACGPDPEFFDEYARYLAKKCGDHLKDVAGKKSSP